MILGVVLVLAVAAAGVKYYYLTPRPTAQTASQATAKGDDLGVIIQKTQEFKANNQTDQSLAYYDSQIKLHAGQADQSEIMIAKARLALDAGRLDIALAAAKQANQTKKSYRTLQLLGDVTKAQGDKPAALDYYKQAIAAIPSNMPMIGPRNIKAQLNAAIAELSA